MTRRTLLRMFEACVAALFCPRSSTNWADATSSPIEDILAAKRAIGLGPVTSSIHVDSPLTTLSLSFMRSADQFMSERVFPEVDR